MRAGAGSSQTAPLQPVRVLAGVSRNFIEDAGDGCFYRPAEVTLGFFVVHGYPGYIVGPLARVGLGTVRRETVAPGGELCQGEGIRDAPAGGVEPLAVHARGGH